MAAKHVDNLRGTIILHEQTGYSILIDRKGANESVSGPRKREELQALAKIETLIAKSKYRGTDADYKNHRDIKAWHTYEALININGKNHIVVIKVRELENGLRFYDSYLLEK